MKRVLTVSFLVWFVGIVGSIAGECCWFSLDMSGWYVGGHGAVGWHNDHNFKDAVNMTKESRSYDVGFGAGISVGKRIAEVFRLEGEWVYRRNKLRGATVPGVGGGEACGHVWNNAFMVNGYFDQYLWSEGFTIYIGGGIGVSLNEMRIAEVAGNSIDGLQRASRDELFAWQLMSGVSYEACNGAHLSIGYRAFFVNHVSSSVSNVESSRYGITHSMDIGVRIEL